MNIVGMLNTMLIAIEASDTSVTVTGAIPLEGIA